jgi:hypothetical protein
MDTLPVTESRQDITSSFSKSTKLFLEVIFYLLYSSFSFIMFEKLKQILKIWHEDVLIW